ncbi:hypothetical protein K493DRAFT_307600 [Basidiobolus meristosporus CBS 931.73]|uniref:Uncharacterized protein n=1 Tax=Basidiobolus meristosporus CBS 931.73 TaxID=1314790 RepID=A0A1Y1XDJ5_9FUNG|nr:hypothetical protein K493DRAFT_307600 [Basidiobolus meristosporus CBS 931.73]|eukprot:ORX83516.1 hypothetical protein K493DRAFT_307600 [Basidiobolus meristosporus CBS 931.73]
MPISTADFESPAYRWVPVKNGEIPTGQALNVSETYYVGRTNHPDNGELVYGTAASDTKKLWYPWGGVEHTATNYETLVLSEGSEAVWIPTQAPQVPAGAVGDDGTYVGRANVGGRLIPGKYIPYKWGGKFFVALHGKEHELTDGFEVLVVKAKPYTWIPVENGEIPTGAALNVSETYYVGRTRHPGNDELVYGTAASDTKKLWYPWGQQEHAVSNYEVLSIGQGYEARWVAVRAPELPEGALGEEDIYVGRTHIGGRLIPGKYIPHQWGGKFFVALHGEEHELTDGFEVLVIESVY